MKTCDWCSGVKFHEDGCRLGLGPNESVDDPDETARLRRVDDEGQ